jgi:phospholipid N-methyltransferase
MILTSYPPTHQQAVQNHCYTPEGKIFYDQYMTVDWEGAKVSFDQFPLVLHASNLEKEALKTSFLNFCDSIVRRNKPRDSRLGLPVLRCEIHSQGRSFSLYFLQNHPSKLCYTLGGIAAGAEMDSYWRMVDMPNDIGHLDLDMHLVSQVFDGNEMEIFLEQPLPQKEATFWTDWTTTCRNWGRYTQLIHPSIIEAALKVLPEASTGRRVRILEIGGGTGALADGLLKRANRGDIDYTLIELNKAEVQEATTLLAGRTTVVQGDVRDPQAYASVTEETADLVIASGILTEMVVSSRVSAEQGLVNAYAKLRPGGVMIITGHGESFVNSFQFNQLKLEILNRHMPNSLLHFYVLRKRAPEPAAAPPVQAAPLPAAPAPVAAADTSYCSVM